MFTSLWSINRLLGNLVSDIKQTKMGVNEMRAVNVYIKSIMREVIYLKRVKKISHLKGNTIVNFYSLLTLSLLI